MDIAPIEPLPHPLIGASGRMRRRAVASAFGHWVDVDTCPIASLALYPFTSTPPLSYVNEQAVARVLDLLERNPETTLGCLAELNLQLSHAIQSLLRPGTSWGQEDRLEVNSPKKLLEFEQIWHPEYQRYCEHVYNHLIRVPLGILGRARGKDYQKPKLSNRVELLKQNGLDALTLGFDGCVRNAIAHGTTNFGTQSIRYIDEKQTRDIWPNRFGELFDDLTEGCHAILVAILIWVARNWGWIESAGAHQLPSGVRRLLLQGWTEHPGLVIHSVLEADIPTESAQANVYCSSTTRSRMVHVLDALTIASGVYYFGGDRYERVLVHIDCGAGVPSLAVFRTEALAALRKDGFSEEALTDAAGDSLLWHDVSGPRRRLWAFRNVLALTWREYKHEVVSNWRRGGLEVWGTRYNVKSVRFGRRRIDAEVVLTGKEEITKHLIRGVLRHATKRLRRTLIPAERLFEREWPIPRSPYYVCIRLHAKDRPTRSLGINGWQDPRVLAQGEWRAWPRWNRPPLFVKMPDEEHRGVLIRYNPNLEITDEPLS